MKAYYREDTIYEKIDRLIDGSNKKIDTLELDYKEMNEFKDSFNYIIVDDELGDFSHYEYRGVRIIEE